MEYLIDTAAISELIKKSPNQGVVEWFENAREDQLYLSVVTVGEIYKGISKLEDQSRARKLEKWVGKDLEERFAGRVLSIDSLIAERWGRIIGEREKAGEKLPVLDALIGATALVRDLVVVTSNVKGIARTGAQVLNPWGE
jgi:predicted nucleic acid-binding protein